MALQGRLTVVQGSLPNSEYPLPLEGEFTIGRNRRTNLPIMMRTVSRKHAKITYRNDAYTIVDLESKSGVLVNDHKVTTSVLRHGDRIQIGRIKFRFWLQVPERPAPQREPQGPVFEVMREPVVIPPKPLPPPPPEEEESEETTVTRFTGEELRFIGRTIGGTKLITALTRTRRAMIYKGTQASHNRVVAFKMLRPEAAKNREIVAWFIGGAKRASELRHEDIVGPLAAAARKACCSSPCRSWTAAVRWSRSARPSRKASLRPSGRWRRSCTSRARWSSPTAAAFGTWACGRRRSCSATRITRR